MYVSSSNIFRLLFGLYLRFCLRFIGLLRSLLGLFLHKQDGFLFLDALVSLLVNLVISVLDIGQFFGHMLLRKIKQEGCNGIVPVCVLEIGYQIIPTNNGFLLGGKAFNDTHFVLSCKIVTRAFILNAYFREMLSAK